MTVGSRDTPHKHTTVHRTQCAGQRSKSTACPSLFFFLLVVIVAAVRD